MIRRRRLFLAGPPLRSYEGGIEATNYRHPCRVACPQVATPGGPAPNASGRSQSRLEHLVLQHAGQVSYPTLVMFVPWPACRWVPGIEALRVRIVQGEVRNGEAEKTLVVHSCWTSGAGVVRLPDSSTVTTALCQLSTQDCLLQTHIEDPAAQIRVGVFAADASYWQFYLGYALQGLFVLLGGGGVCVCVCVGGGGGGVLQTLPAGLQPIERDQFLGRC